jgi:Zn finger protein HypA/HybF involved in hydrogenase expression
MATLADYWVLGKIQCECCGYKWTALCGDFSLYGRAVADFVTSGQVEFKCTCPKCNQEKCQVVEVMGE